VTESLALSFGLAFALMLTPLSRRLALRIGAVDNPGARRIHAMATPRLGGPAIYAAAVLALLLVSLLYRDAGAMMRAHWRSLFALAFGAFCVTLVGAIDDVRSQKPLTKLMVEICAATVVVSGGWSLRPGLASLSTSVFFIVASANAINLVDGIDGLAAGLSLMISVTLLLLSHGRTPPLILSALCGALVGFLPYNLHPAKIFLGDSGALLLGFVIGVGALSISPEMSGIDAMLVPLLAVGLPLGELALTATRRLLRAMPVFAPDRDHIHHRLLSRGLSHRTAVFLLYGVSAAFCGVALAIPRLDDALKVPLLAVVMAGCAGGMRLLGYHRELRPIRSRPRPPLFEFPALPAEIVLASADVASENSVSPIVSEP
jgi:UDP-GlcNAc:undecaprenyl-phosphate GlcNAc-1-phosphate transferase